MTADDKIAEARALIQPLTGHTPGPWVYSERNTPEHFWIEPEAGYLPMPHYLNVSGSISRDNAAIIAAAPALRETVAALADLADAQAQEIARLRALVRISKDLIEAWEWWTYDEYDRDRSVVSDSIDDLRAAIEATREAAEAQINQHRNVRTA